LLAASLGGCTPDGGEAPRPEPGQTATVLAAPSPAAESPAAETPAVESPAAEPTRTGLPADPTWTEPAAEPAWTGPTRAGAPSVGRVQAEPPAGGSQPAPSNDSPAGPASPPPAAGPSNPAIASLTGPDAPISSGDHPGGLFKSAPHDGGPYCEQSETLRAGARLREPIRVLRLRPHRLCADGFPSDMSLTVTLTRPDGSEDIGRTRPGRGLAVVFTNDMPVGEWRLKFTAADGRSPSASGSILVTRPETPTVYQTADRAPSGAAGMSFDIAGFPRNAPVNVFLYRKGDGLVRALPVAITNAKGDASYSVAAIRSDPAGTYGVWMNPPCRADEVECAVFKK
jgi:hypothetical protein